MNNINDNMQNNLNGLNLGELFNFKTQAKYKYPLLMIISVIPMLILIFTLGNEQGYTDGFIWGLSMSVFIADLIILYFLQRFTKDIKVDMFSITLGSTWFFISWYGIYMIGWWNLIVSMIFYVIFYVIGLIIGIIIVIVNQKRKVDNILENLSPNQKENMQNFAQKNSSLFEQSAPKNQEDFLKNLDNELKRQGIDIDKLDEQFGTFLNPKSNNNSKLKENNFDDVNSEVEIIEFLNRQNQEEEEVSETDDFFDDSQKPKIIDQ